MSKPRLLDLFCGAGGAAMGYARAGFEVVGVDIMPQPRYPFSFILADAMTYPLDGFDALHASPPCQEYSSSRFLRNVVARTVVFRPMLLEAVYRRLHAGGVPWLIENVVGAPMPDAMTLCGSMFGLPIRRHRWFASSHLLYPPRQCVHTRGCLNVVGGKVRGYGEKASSTTYQDGRGVTRKREAYYSRAVGCQAMGIEWMTLQELSQAIPPVYTEWLGRQLLSSLV